MNRNTVEVVVQFDRTQRITAEILRKIGTAVRKAAFDVEAKAKVLSPVDTGALRNSIQAHRVDDLNAEIAVGVDYGLFVELGTHRAPAQPFLVPAMDGVRDSFIAAVEEAVKSGGTP